MKGTSECNNKVYICYVDYEKDFDRVDWDQTNDDNTVQIGVGWRDRKVIVEPIH